MPYVLSIGHISSEGKDVKIKRERAVEERKSEREREKVREIQRWREGSRFDQYL